MSGFDSKDTFISQLLNETYQEQSGEDHAADSDELLLYFQNKSRQLDQVEPADFFQEKGITYFTLNFCPSISCYRMKLAGFDLDIPCNWDLFGKLHQTLEQDRTDFFPLWEREYNHFADVLEAFFSAEPQTDQALLAHDGVIYLVLVDQSNYELIEFLNSFQSESTDSNSLSIAA